MGRNSGAALVFVALLRGNSHLSNPPPPLAIEVRPAARAMTTSIGSFSRSIISETRRGKSAASPATGAAILAVLARGLGHYRKDCVDDIRIELSATVQHEFGPRLRKRHRGPV
jgi:hypothetical protein